MNGPAAEISVQLGKIHDRLQEFREQQRIEQARQMETLRGRKPLRFQVQATGANPFALGGDRADQGNPAGPDSGYVWSVRLLVVEGLTASATTPDVVNVRRGTNGRIVWQLNGNQFAQTFGRGEMVLFHGEFLQLTSVGTFAATGAVIMHGLAEQVPAERVGEFY